VKIPTNQNYLRKATKELEDMKKKIDKILDDYLGTILDRKIKIQILNQVWRKL
jgi:hypothetical protein